MSAEEFLKDLFQTALKAVSAEQCLIGQLPSLPENGRAIVIGAGKSAAAMAAAVESQWGDRVQGCVVTRYGHGRECRFIDVLEASHPIPDRNGVAAAQRILATVSGLTAEDLVLCLLSGGGSALLTAPVPGLDLEEKAAITQQLLLSGASIREVNTIRKHLSLVKGGRLGVACWPARACCLTISDAPGDDLSTIASGPLTPDPTTLESCHRIVRAYGLNLPQHVYEYWQTPEAETPHPGDSRLASIEHRIVANAQKALQAAAARARQNGVNPMILSDSLEGEAKDAAKVLGGIARQVIRYAQPLERPCVLLSGGETSVTVGKSSGRGGRNLEFLLALGLALRDVNGFIALACDTDGIDGMSDSAGAILTDQTLEIASRQGLDPEKALLNHDAYSVFAQRDSLIVTGPTLTNVNDFRAIFIP